MLVQHLNPPLLLRHLKNDLVPNVFNVYWYTVNGDVSIKSYFSVNPSRLPEPDKIKFI